jgi:hypothetical protein
MAFHFEKRSGFFASGTGGCGTILANAVSKKAVAGKVKVA